jgi:hypothetical protein
MPESPDFESIARVLCEESPHRLQDRIAEQLRLAWNARGAADIVKIEAQLYADGTSRAGLDKVLDRAIRSLDR